MRVPAYIRRALNAWLAWRAQRRLYSAIPELAALDIARRERADGHRAGARQIDVERRRLVTERLRSEIGDRR